MIVLSDKPPRRLKTNPCRKTGVSLIKFLAKLFFSFVGTYG